jgi:tape measure domain-containing protein
MSAKDLALNLLIKAKDTASGVVRSFRKEVKDSGAAAEELDRELDDVDAGIKSAGSSFNKTGEQVGQFGEEVDRAQRDTRKLRDEVNDIPSAARNAEKGIGGLTRKLVALGSTYLGITAIKNAIIGLINTGSRFEDMSVQINTLMGSIEEGEKATAWIKDFATKTPADIEGITQGFIKLKAFGIDPMNGSYQAIIDQTAKLGFSQEKMEGVILALGQAWTKQKLQGEEALQLIERGVPVWDLLSEATGRTAVELQNMASKGQLGRKEIELLMKAMGENSKGAADEAMKTWTGLVSNLKDMWLNFVNDINEAGVLDYMKQQLKELLDQVNAMAKDGRLKQYAESIASSIITIASSLKQFMASVVGDFEGSIRATGAMIGALKIAINGFTAGVKVIGMGVSAFFSTTLETAAKAMDLVPGFSETAEKLRREAKAMEAVSHEFKEALKEDSNDIRDAWKLLNGEAFDTAKSELEGLQQESIKVGEAAQESGEKAEAAGKAIAEGAGAGEEATRELNRSLEALGVDITKIETGFSEAGRTALDEFAAIQEEIKRTGAAAEQAAELTKASFTKALDQISTTKGLDELKAKLLSAAKEGRLGWGDYQKALEAIEAKYADLEKAAESSIFGQTKQLQALKAQAESAGQAIAGKTGATSENTKANKDNTASTDDQTKSVEKYTHALTMAGKTQQEFAEMGSQMAAEYDRIWQEIESAYKGKEITSTMQYLREMERAEAAMNKMATESINRWRQQETAISNVEQALERGVRVSEQMLNGLDLVDQQRLEGVRSAIRNMNAEAQQVADTLKGTVASLQQQLADLQGDQARSEQIAQEQRMLQLREQYEQAKSTGNTEAVQAAREAIRLQEQIHTERMRQIRQQKVEAAQAQQVASTGDNASRNTPSRPQSPTPTPDRVVRVELDLGMGRPVAGEFEPSATEALLQQLNTVRRTS